MGTRTTFSCNDLKPILTARSVGTHVLLKHLTCHTGLVAERSTQLGRVGTLSASPGPDGQPLRSQLTHTYINAQRAECSSSHFIELILSLSRFAFAKTSPGHWWISLQNSNVTATCLASVIKTMQHRPWQTP